MSATASAASDWSTPQAIVRGIVCPLRVGDSYHADGVEDLTTSQCSGLQKLRRVVDTQWEPRAQRPALEDSAPEPMTKPNDKWYEAAIDICELRGTLDAQDVYLQPNPRVEAV